MMLGAGPLGRAPLGAVRFNPFYVVQTIGRNTAFGTSKIRLRMRPRTIGRLTAFGAVKTRLSYRATSIPSRTAFGKVVLYGWHDASQTYRNLNFWPTQGRVY